MVIQGVNNTAGTLTYSSESVTITSGSTVTIPTGKLFDFFTDPNVVADIQSGNLSISDTVTIYATRDAFSFIKQELNLYLSSKFVTGGITVQVASSAAALSVAGDVASGSSDSGNPVKIGAVYNSSLPTPSTGQRNNLQVNAFAELSVQFRNKFLNIAGNSTTTVKSGAGRLHSIMINDNTTGGTITIYDNTSASSTKIGTFTIGSPSGGLLSTSGQGGPIFLGPLGLEFATGLTVVTSGSSSNNVTILYQ